MVKRLDYTYIDSLFSPFTSWGNQRRILEDLVRRPWWFSWVVWNGVKDFALRGGQLRFFLISPPPLLCWASEWEQRKTTWSVKTCSKGEISFNVSAQCSVSHCSVFSVHFLFSLLAPAPPPRSLALSLPSLSLARLGLSPPLSPPAVQLAFLSLREA